MNAESTAVNKVSFTKLCRKTDLGGIQYQLCPMSRKRVSRLTPLDVHSFIEFNMTLSHK